jgi:hypothetical protein
MSSFTRSMGVLFLWYFLAMLWTQRTLSWMLRPSMNADWFMDTMSLMEGASLNYGSLVKSLATLYIIRMIGLKLTIVSEPLFLDSRMILAWFRMSKLRKRWLWRECMHDCNEIHLNDWPTWSEKGIYIYIYIKSPGFLIIEETQAVNMLIWVEPDLVNSSQSRRRYTVSPVSPATSPRFPVSKTIYAQSTQTNPRR